MDERNDIDPEQIRNIEMRNSEIFTAIRKSSQDPNFSSTLINTDRPTEPRPRNSEIPNSGTSIE